MEDLVVVEANSMDFLVTDLVVLNKKEKVPPHYVVVSGCEKEERCPHNFSPFIVFHFVNLSAITAEC